MVREMSGFRLKKMNNKQLKERLERLGNEYNKVIWNLETESGIGMNRETLFLRKEIIEQEIEKTESYMR